MDLTFLSHQDISQGEALIKAKAVGSVFFSEGTYQVEVKDPKKKSISFWPFLQLDDSGKILDCFCSCVPAEKHGSCPHLAAAALTIFRGNADPLHVRFRESLWHQLCQIASRRQGFDPKILNQIQGGGFEAVSQTGKKLFFVRPLNEKAKKRLKELLMQRKEETEETSLKFSNLSHEELLLWRGKRPSLKLMYELSFWSDLAKWLMLLQEEGHAYKLEIQEKEDKLPKWIIARFASLEIGFYISEANWSQIIPSLTSVQSPLAVYELPFKKIHAITYDPLKKCLNIETVGVEKEALSVSDEKAQQYARAGGWYYVPHKGFYPERIDPSLQEPVIPEKKIEGVLQKHSRLIEKYLKKTKLFRDSIAPHYTLSIDPSHLLHIKGYLFEPGDLQKELSHDFGSWVYLEGKGFYHLDNPLFSRVTLSIPKDRVSEFINQHRHWLGQFEGFQTHIASLEIPFFYRVTEERALIFEAKADLVEEEAIDFGEWVYFKDKGFYPKSSSLAGRKIKSGLSIPSREISSFIHAHREELEQIKGFFSSSSPLAQSGLILTLTEEDQIRIAPHYLFKEGFSEEKVRFFGDFVYVSGEGFSEIPFSMKLPFEKERLIDPHLEPNFVLQELETLRSLIISLPPELIKPVSIQLMLNRLRRDPIGWIFDLEYVSELGSVSLLELWNAIKDKNPFLFSKAGLILLHKPEFQWLKTLSKKSWLKRGKFLRLSTLQWFKISTFERPLFAADETSRKFLEELENFQTSIPMDLSGFKSHLRTYQERGVEWLWFLYCYGLSGLLCDEMGLGKTHQAMGLIAAVSNRRKALLSRNGRKKDLPLKVIIVCPTSVIYHWQELLSRFLPALRVLVFYGALRSLENFETAYDILLTSYGVLRSERKTMVKYHFDLSIFDEVQIAKNAHSLTHKALRKIDATMRLGLTGTPIENRLSELKALLDVVLPTFLPGEALFRSLFVNPIEKNQDPDKKALLSRLIKPFILRRKKAEVLSELPEKTEEIAYCDLSEEQKKLYQEEIAKSKEKLLEELLDESKPAPYLHVFAMLSKLKQICNHPCLINKRYEEYRKHASGKWDLFLELLHETRDSGQKLVVFSQYLGMLDIIEKYLQEESIGFAGIRGSTRDRKEQVFRFRDDPSCEVFVGSLQAAGVGIDLIAASVVIHYDRWWNPAKENQATDRVHRIGQSRGVQVFKMVTKGTIEEHIHRLIEKKKGLAEGIIAYNDEEELKRLDRTELIQILHLMNLGGD